MGEAGRGSGKTFGFWILDWVGVDGEWLMVNGSASPSPPSPPSSPASPASPQATLKETAKLLSQYDVGRIKNVFAES